MLAIADPGEAARIPRKAEELRAHERKPPFPSS